MQALKICDIGLPPDTSHAFHSMLKIVDGRSSASWQLSDIACADVLLAHANGDSATLAQWNLTGKPVVLVIDDRGSWPPAPFVLRHPFRVMQLLSMLDSVAEHLRTPRAPRTQAAAHGSAWITAESLRPLMGHTGAQGWHMAHSAEGAQVWVGDGHAHALPEATRQLRSGPLALGAFRSTPEPPPSGAQRLPLCDAAWFVGLHGPAELAPWLSQDTAYRLRRWPDFGRLGAIPHLIELAALTATRTCTVSALTALSGHAPASVHRFLAASSLSGLLTAPSRSEDAAPTATRSTTNGWMRFVGGLRRHLGLVA